MFMKKSIIQLIICTFLFQGYIMAQSLDNHQWQNRIVLLFTDLEETKLQSQLKLFAENQSGLNDRKITVYQITADAAKKNGNDFWEENFKTDILKEYQIKKDEFTFILIGLDGGEKMRSTEVVSLKKLFSKIDKMPMRQIEIKDKSYK